MATYSGTSRDLVRQTLHHDSPDRVPLYLFNRDFERADIVAAHLVTFPKSESGGTDAWGQVWKRLDETMGQPDEPVVHSAPEAERLEAPSVDSTAIRRAIAEVREDHPDVYLLGSLAITGFNRAAFLRGFDAALEDMLLAPESFIQLLETVCEYEETIVAAMAGSGVDAVALWDDWGMQGGLVTSPALFRELVLPRYRRQFAMIHELGMEIYFHSCGNIEEIAVDLVEAGVDLLNISQPNCNDLGAIGEYLRGRTTFVVPISYQTTSISGTPDEIHVEAKRMFDHLAGPRGGFIGYVEEYTVMGMSERNYQACIGAFRSLPGW